MLAFHTAENFATDKKKNHHARRQELLTGMVFVASNDASLISRLRTRLQRGAPPNFVAGYATRKGTPEPLIELS